MHFQTQLFSEWQHCFLSAVEAATSPGGREKTRRHFSLFQDKNSYIKHLDYDQLCIKTVQEASLVGVCCFRDQWDRNYNPGIPVWVTDLWLGKHCAVVYSTPDTRSYNSGINYYFIWQSNNRNTAFTSALAFMRLTNADDLTAKDNYHLLDWPHSQEWQNCIFSHRAEVSLNVSLVLEALLQHGILISSAYIIANDFSGVCQ